MMRKRFINDLVLRAAGPASYTDLMIDWISIWLPYVSEDITGFISLTLDAVREGILYRFNV